MEIEPIGSNPSGLARNTEAVGEQTSSRRVEQTQRRPSDPAEAGKLGPIDTVEISDRARELARAQQAVEAAPDVREDRVAEIKRQIENGTYNVPASVLASKLLGGPDGSGA